MRESTLHSAIFGCSPHPIITFSETGAITSWNKAAEALLGYTASHAFARQITDFLVDKVIDNVLPAGPASPRTVDIEWHTSAGAVLTAAATVAQLTDESGALLGTMIIFNATNNPHNDALHVAHTIADNIPNIFATVVDAQGTYLFAGGDELATFGYGRKDLVGKPVATVLAGRDTGFLTPLRQAALNGDTVSREFIEGDKHYILRCAPVERPDGTIIGALTIGQNLSPIKNAEREIKQLNELLEKKVAERTAQLEAANNELEAFSFSVSHDLRAPLRIISSYADILQSDYARHLDDDGIKVVEVIKQGAKKMSTQIEALLNLSRLGRKTLNIKLANMNEIAGDIISDIKELSGSAIHFDSAHLLPCYCDRTLIHHVWYNLIANAVKYSRNNPAPHIAIDSWSLNDSVVYSVKDNGVGFDMQYSDKLFGVFQRLHKQSEFEGTGVGLALVQRIINKHGGKVWAEAEPSKGATFFFCLPYKQDTDL